MIKKLQLQIEDRLRRMCGRITPEKRLFVILTALVFLSALSIYITISSIYNIGKRDGERIRIEHIEKPELRTEPDRNGTPADK